MTELETKLADKMLMELLSQQHPSAELVTSYQTLIRAACDRYYLARRIEEDKNPSPVSPISGDYSLGGRKPASEETV